MIDEEKLERKTKRKTKNKKKDTEEIKPKRVIYSWLNNRKACQCKAYLAYLADRKIQAYLRLGDKKKFFEKYLLPRVLKKFPTLYDDIRDFYQEKGKTLTQDHYKDLLYARFVNMYDSKLRPEGEHPKYTGNEGLRKAYIKYKTKSKKQT